MEGVLEARLVLVGPTSDEVDDLGALTDSGQIVRSPEGYRLATRP
jgi:hypothetical protein